MVDLYILVKVPKCCKMTDVCEALMKVKHYIGNVFNLHRLSEKSQARAILLGRVKRFYNLMKFKKPSLAKTFRNTSFRLFAVQPSTGKMIKG